MTTVRVEKPAILAEIPKDRHAVIEASAGTGKTFTIENLIVELLLAGTRIEQILVVTFTERATGELRKRVREKIQLLAEATADTAGEEMPDERCFVVDDAGRERLAVALSSFDSATISTIHSFCQRALAENAFAAHRLFAETQVEGRDAFSRVFTEALRDELARDGDKRPWLQAWLAAGGTVDGLESLLFAISRARGEVRPVLDAAALDAAIDGLPDEGDLAARIAKELELAKVHASTRTAIKKRLAELLPRLGELRRAAGTPVRLAAVGALRDDLPYLLDKLPTDRKLAPACAGLARALFALDAAAVPLSAAIAGELLAGLEARLARHKREAGLFDFDDMLAVVAGSLHDGARGDELARELRERYRYALIDEFQDTDEVQWSIFRKVFFEGEGRSRLYVIGDPKQAIYGFRGADVVTYLGAKRELLAAGGVLVVLDKSYRSCPALVAAYNAILDQQAPSPFFSGDIRYDAPVTAGRATLHGLTVRGDELSPVAVLHVEGYGRKTSRASRAVASSIAAEIAHLLSEAADARFDGRRLAARDVYVLTRNSAEGRLVGEHLRERGVRFGYYKEDGLFQTDEAASVRVLLAAIDAPHDRKKRQRAYLTPFFEIPLAELEACADPPGTHPLVSRLFEWKARADAGDFTALFTAILEGSGIVRRGLFFGDRERELVNYLHLFELLGEEAARTRATLRELVYRLDAFIDRRALPSGEDGGVQRLETERDAVQIMTMHKSKGLEAAVVFLAGGVGPTKRDAYSIVHDGGARIVQIEPAPASAAAAIAREKDEEDQRLLYVALTRAKARLYLPLYGPMARAEGKKGQDAAPSGCYRQLDARLRALLADDGPMADEVELVELSGADDLAEGRVAAEPSFEGFSLPAGLAAAQDDRAEFDALEASRAGFTITSYTRMAAAEKGHAPQGRVAPEERLVEASEVDRTPAEAELPPGNISGSFLHELLELLPYETVLASSDLAVWRDLPETAQLLRETASRHGIEERYLEHASRLVHTALASSIALGGGRTIRLAAAERTLREVEFLYPIPEASHPRLAEQLAPGTRLEIRRGFVKGFIDFVFEDAGLVYFGDWKSDTRSRYDRDSLGRQVDESYAWQVRLYSLAVVKMLGVRSEAAYESRFGGVLYCYLRGMGLGGDGAVGTHFRRPSWGEVCQWELELATQDRAGLRPFSRRAGAAGR